MVRGLCCDINKLEVARSTNDDSMVKRTEQNLSYGLQTLAEIMKDDTTDHLVFERECILTAFSLNPTPDLYEKIVALAQRSGFIQSESMDLDSKDEVCTCIIIVKLNTYMQLFLLLLGEKLVKFNSTIFFFLHLIV